MGRKLGFGVAVLTLVCGLPIVYAPSADAAGGTLDPTFGTGGVKSLGFGLVTANESSREVIALADGRSLVAGGASEATPTRPFVARLTGSGVLDPSFGVEGLADIPTLGPTIDAGPPWSMASDSAGGAWVAGEVIGQANAVYVAHVSSTGALDSGFGGDGVVVYQGPEFTGVRDLEVDGGGRPLLLVGQQLVRFTLGGGLDSSFGSSGVAQDEGLLTLGDGQAMARRSSGEIVVATHAFGQMVGVIQFAANGQLDTTFAQDGSALVDLDDNGSTNEQPQDVALDSSGRILVSGGVFDLDTSEFSAFVTRLTDGELDSSFGAAGVHRIDGFVYFADHLRSVGNKTYFDIFAPISDEVVRLDESGDPDLTFGASGTLAVGNGCGVRSFDIDPAGRPLVLQDTALAFADCPEGVARYLSDGSGVDESYAAFGSVPVGHKVESDDALGAVIDLPDGRSLLIGSTTGSLGLLRVTSAGQPDPSFGSNGRVAIPLQPTVSEVVAASRLANGDLLVAYRSGYAFESSVGRLVRITPAGALVDSYGSGGSVELGGAPTALSALSDGRVAVQTTQGLASDVRRIDIERYESDGSPSVGFAGGSVAVDLDAKLPADHFVTAGSVSLLSSGVVYATASTRSPTYSTIGNLVVALGPSGAPVGAFDVDGVLINPRGPGVSSSRTPLGILPVGNRVLLAGGGCADSVCAHPFSFVAAILSTGAFDGSWGQSGVATFDALPDSSGVESATDLALDSAGRVYASVVAFDPSQPPPAKPSAVVSMLGSGQTALGFGSGGVAGGFDAALQDLAFVDSLHRPRVAGTTTTPSGDLDFYVGRLLAGSPPAPPPSPGGIVSVSPARVADTRAVGQGPCVGAGATRTVTVAGVGGVPASGVGAVAVNVTATQPSAGGYLTVWPTGQSRPLASSLNFAKGQTIPNLVIAKVGTGGKISVYNSTGCTHVIVDVVGWFKDGAPAAGGLTGVTPARVADTRAVGQGPCVGAGATRTVTVAGVGGVPASGVGAVAVNVTATQPSAGGYLTVWPTGQSRPLASSLNFAKGQTIPNLVIAKVGTGGKISVYNSTGCTHVIVDVVGWFGLAE